MKARRWAPSKPDMTTPRTLPERLLDTAENIHSRGAGIAEKMLREAAEAITQHRGQLEAYREHCHELGQHLVEAHKPGEVDPEAVAILDGYHIGTRTVAGGGAGEPGEVTLEAALRLLKLALARGAFRPPQLADLPPEQEAAVALFRPHVSVARMLVDGQWQGFYRDGVVEGIVVQADDVPAAERAVAVELARRAYPSLFPSS